MFYSAFAALTVVATAKKCDITHYGAKESHDGGSNSDAISKAIKDCLSGGEVVVPKGTFQTKPFAINGGKDFTFTLSSGSSLQGVPRSEWPSSGSKFTTFLEINNCKHCTVRGNGKLDGKGSPWYKDFDAKKFSKHRPDFVVVQGGSHVKFLDLTLLNAPMINLKIKDVDTFEVGHISVISEWYKDGKEEKEPHNTDAINPGDGSKNGWIHDVHVSNGDDGIAIKPGEKGKCTKNILIENSRFERGHGLSIGSVGEGCVEDIYFRHNTVTGKNSANGCRIKTEKGKTGYVRNITYEDIDISNTKNCITVSQNYHDLSALESDAEFINVTSASTKSSKGIEISDIKFIDIKGKGCSTDAEFICDSKTHCKDIYLEDVQVSGGKGMKCSNAYGAAKHSISSCLKSGGSQLDEQDQSETTLV